MSSTQSQQRKQIAKTTSKVRTATDLVELARAAREHAFAPYSKFRVGAAVETRDGRIFTGCNVENSSYGLSMCAERVALFKAISEGEREFTRIAVIADSPQRMPVRPCGACRQVISDLMGTDAEVIMSNLDGELESHSVKELLPAPFDRSYL
jgi:cytidine deaminase